MNNVNINNEDFMNTQKYQDYMKENPGIGYLMIRAFAAGGALPISNLKVVVSHVIEGTNVIFFEGYTDDSGMIQKIALPTPKEDLNDLNVPSSALYDIVATYETDSSELLYKVKMYDKICVVQNINIVPELKRGINYGG